MSEREKEAYKETEKDVGREKERGETELLRHSLHSNLGHAKQMLY